MNDVVKFKDLYEILGLTREATTDQVKAAFREIAKKHHPDKPDSNIDLFLEAKEAFDILSDPERRRIYDERGIKADNHTVPLVNEAFDLLNQIFDKMIDAMLNNQMNTEIDVINSVKSTLRDNIRAAQSNIATLTNKSVKFEKVRAKFSLNSGKNAELGQVILSNMDKKLLGIKQEINIHSHRKDVFELALENVDIFSYSFTPQQPTFTQYMSTTSNNTNFWR